MRFLRVLVNILMCIALMFSISALQVGVFDIVAAESPSVEAIHIFNGDEDKVAVGDAYTFWATDIGTNFSQPTKMRVSKWVDAKAWRVCTGWIDKSLDIVIAAVKPIIVPIAQVNAVMTYYDRDISYFYEDIAKQYSGNDERMNVALYEYAVIFADAEDSNFYNPEGNVVYMYNSKNYDSDPDNDVELKPITEFDYENANDSYKSDTYYRWVKKNSALYNHNWKLNKYNCGSYDKYFYKFIKVDGDVRNIKAAVIVLYYQQLISLVLAIVFTIKYPISFIQGRYTGKRRISFGRHKDDDVSL